MALKASQKSLKKWTRQKWDYLTKADRKKPKSKRGRYLPKSVRTSLTPAQRAYENRKKRRATKSGKQRASYSKSVRRKMRGK
jgi:hypothetical protein|tara:strand:- start:210 stop:455 length:246 start_codon:yes stop_codon:yes gene_type:complete